nr:S-layer homology domain-containing protein [uncultured Oscillibacter sp.]
MKKFLSLVLVLVMTMSLVTISAGATEYKDLTDKDEIQYEEAVAVLNRIGIITGYEDGSFRPETELTRGAAAKIIVSLMIGPEAAAALPNNQSPYPDVPAGHTFAGVISYCKTAEYISGYGDGTFKPANSLTGYAFAKMLLGALGYKSDVEGFTGTGWTMNVARLGNEADLFNRIEFDGAASVNREEACQLALNTLKATMVEYTGGVNINTASGDTMTVNPTRSYKISNQDYAKNISNRKASDIGNAVTNNHYTVEFGEEHFKDLRLDNEHQGKLDDFGRPSNVWSFKKVTIGTFPIEPDFVYTTQVAHNVPGTTDASKVRALGLSGYETTGEVDGKKAVTKLTVNGCDDVDSNIGDVTNVTAVNKIADIADLTDNGTLVEVYVSEDDADFICNVVVVKTQLMEVKRVGSDYVALDKVGADDKAFGYNDDPIDEKLEDVEVEDAYYSTLHELKAGDLVAVIPVTTDGGATWTVAKAYVPEEAKGSLTRVDTYGDTTNDRKAISVTVGGTEYKIAQWNKDLTGIDGDSIRVTKKDVTLILDQYGNALQAKDVGDTSNWMVVKNFRQTLVNNVIVNVVNGWDIGGDTLSLNVGTVDYRYTDDIQPGDLVYYSNNTNSNIAEWTLSKNNNKGVFDVDAEANGDGTNTYEIKASNTTIALDGYGAMVGGVYGDRATIDTGIKFIYVTVEDGEVDHIEFTSGVKATKNEEILGLNSNALNKNAQACVSLKKGDVTDESAIKAVVIKHESSDASIGNLLYISNYHGSATKYDNDNRPVYGYEAIMMGSDGKVSDEKAVVYSYKNLKIGQFARYTKIDAPEGVTGVDDNFYDLRGYGIDANADTWGRSAAIASTQLVKCLSQDKRLVRTNTLYGNTRALANPNIASFWNDKDSLNLGDTDASNLLNTRGASWIDLRNVKDRIEDIDDLKDWLKEHEGKAVDVHILFNDNIDSNDFRHAYLIVVVGTSDDKTPEGPAAGKLTIVDEKSGLDKSDPANGATVKKGDVITVTVKDGFEATATNADVTVSGNVYTFTATSDEGVTVTITEKAAGVYTLKTENGFSIDYKLITAGTKTFMDATIEYPEWVSDTAGVTVSGKVGVFIGTADLTAGGKAISFTRAAKDGGVGRATVDLGMVVDPDTMTIGELSTGKITASDVKVRFVSGDGADVSKYVVAGAGTTATLSTTAGADLSLTLSTSAAQADIMSKVTLTTTGLSSDVTSKTAVKAFTNQASTAILGATPTAKGNGYVTVTLYGLDDLTVAYTVAPMTATAMNTLPGGNGLATAATIALAGSPATGDSGPSDIMATIANLDGNYGIVVDVTLETGEHFNKIITSTAATSIGSVTLDKNYDLSKATVTVTKVPALALEGTPTNVGTAYTFTFNRDIALGDGYSFSITAGASQATVNSARVEGNKLILNLSAPLVTGNVVNAAAVTDIVDAEYEDNDLSATAIFTVA